MYYFNINLKFTLKKMFAIFRKNGKQYHVNEGDTIRLDKIKSEPGSVFETNEILAISEKKGDFVFGAPILKDAKIIGKILSHGKDKKVIVFKRKRRKTYRRKYGHRQTHTLVKIETINSKASSIKNTKSDSTMTKKDETKKSQSKRALTASTSTKKTTNKNINK